MSAVVEDNADGFGTALALGHGDGSRPIAFSGTEVVSLAQFQAQVRALAAQLPEGHHAINLCEDRYRFLVAFAAVALRGQVTLLPPSRAPGLIEDELRRHPDSYCLGDLEPQPSPSRFLRLPATLVEAAGPPPLVDDAALAAIGFTSGSTGTPVANPKTWRSLRTSTGQNLLALRDLWLADAVAHIVATVPPQHMYGLELSVLLPLLGEVAVHATRPLFPDDVARALADAPAHRLLVTTPVHLRALVESGLALPALAGIVSATAPLPRELAAAAEARFGCEVRELFGSTETCVIARRRTAREQAWTPLPGVRLQSQPGGSLVHAPHLRAPVALADLIELHADGSFELRGRNADLLEIAGKRASLGDLTRQLQAVPGVLDAVVFQLDDADAGGVRRIAALAVAPGRDPAQILQVLRGGCDPVFLPRPLRLVDRLPRNATGKLPRQDLLRMLRDRDREQGATPRET